MLPKDVMEMQGQRVFQNMNDEPLTALMQRHKLAADEISDLNKLIQQAEQVSDSMAVLQLTLMRDKISQVVKEAVNRINVHVKGRLFRQKSLKDALLYQIETYDSSSGNVCLRRLYDPNGILISHTNMSSKVLWKIQGASLGKFFEMLRKD